MFSTSSRRSLVSGEPLLGRELRRDDLDLELALGLVGVLALGVVAAGRERQRARTASAASEPIRARALRGRRDGLSACGDLLPQGAEEHTIAPGLRGRCSCVAVAHGRDGWGWRERESIE